MVGGADVRADGAGERGGESADEDVVERRGRIEVVRGERGAVGLGDALEGVAESGVEEDTDRPLLREPLVLERGVEVAGDDRRHAGRELVDAREQLPGGDLALEAVEDRLALDVLVLGDEVALEVDVEERDVRRPDVDHRPREAARRIDEVRGRPPLEAGAPDREAREDRDLLQAAVGGVEPEVGADREAQPRVAEAGEELPAGLRIADLLREEDVGHALPAEGACGGADAALLVLRRADLGIAGGEPLHVPGGDGPVRLRGLLRRGAGRQHPRRGRGDRRDDRRGDRGRRASLRAGGRGRAGGDIGHRLGRAGRNLVPGAGLEPARFMGGRF